MTEDAGLAVGRVQDAGEYFDGGRLAGAVGSDETEQFSFLHVEGYAAHGVERTEGRPEEGGEGAAQAGGLAFGLEGLAQVADGYGGHEKFLVLGF